MPMQEVVPGVYSFEGLRVGRAYAIADDNDLMIIDTSMQGMGHRITKMLHEAGHDPSSVSHILITHPDPDHIGGLAELVEATNAPIVASEESTAVIGDSGMTVAKVIEDGDSMASPIGDLTAIVTGGHRRGHTVFWQADRHILFSGDAFAKFAVLPYSRLPAFLADDLALANKAVATLAQLEPEVICPGHGPPLTENASQHLRDAARKLGTLQLSN